jgi:uncharacterized membrane protein
MGNQFPACAKPWHGTEIRLDASAGEGRSDKITRKMTDWLRTVDSTVLQSVRRVLLAAAMALLPAPALADFHICNNSGSRVGVAIGYKEADGQWTTEGWWNLSARSCETLLKGSLIARYYYIYAVDYDRGGEWAGQAFMCSREKEFTIRGTEDCLARGYDRTGFFEVDTGEQRSWTVQLTESGETPPQRPFAPGLLPTPGRQGPSPAPGSPGR